MACAGSANPGAAQPLDSACDDDRDRAIATAGRGETSVTVQTIVAIGGVIAVLTGLAATHVYWALGGQLGRSAAVPTGSGRPLFVPSRIGTLAVAAALFVAAWMIAGTAEMVATIVPNAALQILTFAIFILFLARAIGDFRTVGFFAPPGDSAFAARDARLYSPLCAIISGAAFVVAWWR